MSIEGRIAIDVNFADSATSSGVQSLKKISLIDTTSYTSGQVAIVTGTVGTAAITFNPPTFGDMYKDASGNAPTFTNGVSRIAFASSSRCKAQALNFDFVVISDGNRVAVSDVPNAGLDDMGIALSGTAATAASYTLVLYGT